MDKDKLYQVALHLIPGIGSSNIKNLISYCGSAEKVLKTPRGKLARIPGIGTITAGVITSSSTLREAEKEIERAFKSNVKLLFYTDPTYPKRLRAVNDAPPILYFKGNGDLNSQKTVAIVGTRKATNYGKEMTDKIVAGLTRHNATIVSGLAYGIDIHAHKAALIHNMPTIGIMACGMDHFYPAAHKKTSEAMLESGGLITENRFGVKPDAHRFPARNRIIAGMADAVIIVEAAKKGGALITAEIANGYHRDVFAFPGDAGSTYSEGCNQLIKSNKANLITQVEDIEYLMNWDVDEDQTNRKNIRLLDLASLDANEKGIIELFNNGQKELLIDDISHKAQMSISQVASALLSLEFKGVLKSLPGKKYKLSA